MKKKRKTNRARVLERQMYAVQMLDAVMPGVSAHDVRPWPIWAKLAGEHSETNGVSDTYFRTGRRLENYINNNRSVIKHVSERTGLRIVSKIFRGICRGGKKDFDQWQKESTSILDGRMESHNLTVENVKAFIALPSVRLAILPPPRE